MLRLYQAGDRSAGICETCLCKVTTTMGYRDYTPTGWDVTVPDVLVDSCDRCGRVVSIPHQSTPKINEYRKEKNSTRKAIEARVSRDIVEAIELITANLGGEPRFMRPVILRYYLNLVAKDPKVALAVKDVASEPLGIKGKADPRLSLKILASQWDRTWAAARKAGIKNTVQLIRGVTILVTKDFQVSIGSQEDQIPAVISKESKQRSDTLRALAQSF